MWNDVEVGMAKLIARDDFPLPVIEELRRFGHDVVTVPSGALRSAPLDPAAPLRSPDARRRIWLSLDPDQSASAHRAAPGHSGIVSVKPGKNYAGLAQRIHDALKAHARISRQLILVDGEAEAPVPASPPETTRKTRRRHSTPAAQE
jgi:hypothetical protein